MTLEYVLISIVGLMCTVLGWIARQLWDAVQNLRKDLSELQVNISKDYVRYDRLKDALEPIMTTLHEIKQSLSAKADK